MKPTRYPQGSEWRKWDLQVHTPFSYLNNGFGTDLDAYVVQLFKRALENDIAVIGIADYFCIEGYKRLKTEYLNNDTKLQQLFTAEEIEKIKKITLLPNVELRLDNFVEQRVNFHVLFSEDVSIEDIEQNFLHELHFVEQGRPQTVDERRTLTLANLKELGERLKTEQATFADRDPMFVGMMNAVIPHTEITDVLVNKKSLFENKYLIGIPVDEDLSQVSWDAQGHLTRKVLYQKCDFFLTSQPNTREFGLGLKHDSVAEYLQEFGALKPCLWSSDSHTYDKMFVPDENRHTWIKADPSFEGLRQVKFEPAERVKIQADKPDEKRPYFVIDKVRFIDNTGKNNFGPEYIPLNQNLSTVIGGKSTGKSLLLYYIAKTVDETELKKVESLRGSEASKDYSFDEENDFDFEVVWKDGETSQLKTPAGGEVNPRKIIYIPQHYLNQLSEKEIQSRQTLNSFIEAVILEDEQAAEYQDQKKFEIVKIEKEISKELNNLFSIQEDIDRAQADIKDLGDEKGIEKYKEALTKQVEAIKGKSGLSPEEMAKFESVSSSIKRLELENTALLQDKKSATEFVEALRERVDTQDLFEEYKGYFTNDTLKEQLFKDFDFVKEFPSKVEDVAKRVLSAIETRIEDNKKALVPLNAELAPFSAKVQMQAELETQSKLLKQEEEKLVNVQAKKKNLLAKQTNFEQKKKVILESYRSLFGIYEELQDEFKKYSSRLKDIDLNIVVGFKDEEFNTEVVNQFLNKNDLKKLPNSSAVWTEEFEYIFNPAQHLTFVEGVFEGLVGGVVKTIKNRNVKDALQKLLDNKFYVDFRISYKTDSLDKMSPGKKGLVLLKILVDLSNEEWPIILDQPEDDLDNRSVYTDLVEFIKTKKRERQIIIATHNPNLVVGADAEEVVVANQSGQDIGRENDRYKFEYVSGSLEHSFKDKDTNGVLNQMGVRQHVCEVLEGGEEAFHKREQKYSLEK